MALRLPASFPAVSPCSSTRLQTRSCISIGSFSNGFSESRVQCMAVTKIMCDKTIIRRSGNYKPSIWGYDYVQSLRSRYAEISYAERIKNLKQDVRLKLDEEVEVDALHQLELVDALQRLGISYHFEKEIQRVMNTIYNKRNRSYDDRQKQESLYAVALEFRLLRQHGYDIPSAGT